MGNLEDFIAQLRGIDRDIAALHTERDKHVKIIHDIRLQRFLNSEILSLMEWELHLPHENSDDRVRIFVMSSIHKDYAGFFKDPNNELEGIVATEYYIDDVTIGLFDDWQPQIEGKSEAIIPFIKKHNIRVISKYAQSLINRFHKRAYDLETIMNAVEYIK